MTVSTRPPSPAAGRSRARVVQVAVVLIAVAVAQLVLDPIRATPASAMARFSGNPVVRVSGHRLVDGSGKPIRLLGVDQAGAESSCVAGDGFGTPPPPTPSGTSPPWRAGRSMPSGCPSTRTAGSASTCPTPRTGGAAYRSAIVAYVDTLNAAGMAVILDLHWGAPGTELATGGEVMADESHSPAFWSSVAATFKGNRGVVFDLFNEPRHLPFACLVHGGCTVKGVKVAGYDQLISDVRDTGATNVVMVAGIDFAANPSGFKTAMPHDPLGQLAISVHVYNFNAAKSPATWSKWVRMGLLSKVPFVTGELGERDCTAKFIDTYTSWADAHGVSYLAWAFNSGPCNGPYLIDAGGNPTPYGAGYKAHLAHLAP